MEEEEEWEECEEEYEEEQEVQIVLRRYLDENRPVVLVPRSTQWPRDGIQTSHSHLHNWVSRGYEHSTKPENEGG